MLKNMKIGKKLILSFIAITLISSIGGIAGLFSIIYMETNYTGVLRDFGFSQGNIGLFYAEFNKGREIVRKFISADSQTMETYSEKLAEVNKKVDTYFSSMEKGMVDDREKQEYSNIKKTLAEYRSVSEQVVSLSEQYKNADAQELLTNQAEPLSDQIESSINSLISEKTTAGNQIGSNLAIQGKVVRMAILLVIVIAFLISLFIAAAIARGISKPVKEMSEAAQKMARGELDVDLSASSSKDEIGILGAAFSETVETMKTYITDIKNNLAQVEQGDLTVSSSIEYKGDFNELRKSIYGIVTSFNDTLSQINRAAEQVSSGSDQLAGGAQALAQGAAEQASSVQELSTTITEIAGQVKSNAEDAAEANTNINLVNSEIEASSRHMEAMVGAMTQINDSSSNIVKIIKTIEDIAFQTNILALNAAVEAARAGAAGKGFAVVADEVRNLASKSSEAAKDTTALIENSMSQVENGTKIAGETAQSLSRVVKSAKTVAEIIGSISLSSNRQSDAIGQVTQGMEQISRVVQTNSATAEESAASSEELSVQAQMMKGLVGKFSLREEPAQEKNNIDPKDRLYSDESAEKDIL